MNYYLACAVSFALGMLTVMAIWAVAALRRQLNEFKRDLQSQS